MQEKIIEELRQELKEQIKENQELEKKVDGLVTVIDLAKQMLQDWNYLDKIDCYYEPKEVLEILERVNEK